MRFLQLVPLFLCLSLYPAFGDEGHDDHHEIDHDDHDHHGDHNHGGEEKGGHDTVSLIQHLGFDVEMVEDRMVGGTEVIALPISSIFTGDGKPFVFARDEKDPSKFSRWEVHLGKSDGRFVEAKAGVFPGDKVVVKKGEPTLIQARPPQFGYVPKPKVSQHPQPKPTYGFPSNSHREFGPRSPQYTQPSPVYPDEVRVPQNRSYRPVDPRPEREPNLSRELESGELYGEEFFICPHGNIHRIQRFSSHQPEVRYYR